MIENQKNPSNCCKYCGWEFQNDIIQKIIEEQESVVCEFCGIEINISSIRPRERIIKENYEKTSNSKDKVEKKKKSIVKSISKLIKTKKYSVNVILGDKDFPKIFKENLIIVISRLIYKFIREWEQDNDVNIRQVGLTQTILITLAKKVKPIINKRIHNSYLENLHEVTIEEFEEWVKLLQKKIRSIQEYRKHFLIYLLWLTKLVFRLVSDMWEMKNLPKFQATIIKDLKTYPIPLREVPEVKTHQKLFNDGERKECGRCHEIKPFDNFEFRRDSRKENGYYRNNCKECRLECKQIYALRNKCKIIQNIYKGKLKGKCQKCNTSIERLPSLDFHHPIPELKSRRIKFGHINWEKAMKKLENERVNLECKNCHSQEQAKNYYKYERFIQGFEKKFQEGNPNPAQIEKAIGKLVRQHSEHIHVNDRPQFKRWVRKYIVISELYNGKCIACEQITIKNNLPGLQFHHRNLKNPNRKKWKKLLFRPIPEIVKTLKSENCVGICANCQRMIHSHQFKKNHENIVESEYWDRIKLYYKIAEKNIESFKFR